MTKTLVILAAAAALPALAQAPKPVHEVNIVTVKGKIEAIDKTTRQLTVNIDGQLHTFSVKPDVKRFDQLKVGDTLKADYHEAVLMEVRQPGAAAPEAASGGKVLRVPGQGQNISGAIAQQEVASVEVKAIDLKTPAVTVLTSDARTVTMKVAHPERLQGLKVGDKIDVTYTKALIVNVQ